MKKDFSFIYQPEIFSTRSNKMFHLNFFSPITSLEEVKKRRNEPNTRARKKKKIRTQKDEIERNVGEDEKRG